MKEQTRSTQDQKKKKKNAEEIVQIPEKKIQNNDGKDVPKP